MYADVEEYFKIEAEAKEAYAAGEKAAQERYAEETSKTINRDARIRVTARYNAVASALGSLRNGAIDLAWANLQDSDDKLVSFIARNCGAYRNDSEPYALVILRLLPASLEQIKQAAIEGSWCNVFDNFMTQAINEGVIEDTRSPARRELEQWVTSNLGGRYWSNILPRVEQVIAQEAEAFLAAKNGTAPAANSKGQTTEIGKGATPEPAEPAF